MDKKILLEIKGLKKYFLIRSGVFSKIAGYVQAVDGVSFYIKKGEIFGLVGESGCGKTTTGRLILRLLEPTEGEVDFEGENIFKFDKEKMRGARRNMQIIFQDPFASLNPRMTVGDIIGEPLIIHKIARGKEKEKRVSDLLETVGMEPRYKKRYPIHCPDYPFVSIKICL
ncbi:Oligopeptide transport ATP-binding protein OppF [subsurface metagenome]